MTKFTLYISAVLLFLASLFVFNSTAAATDTSNPNDAPYWQARTEHASQCFKHTPQDSPNEHGAITDGNKAVTLNVFNQSWFGDHWELLIVNGGSGNTVINHPVAGVAYFPPLNSGGQQPNISHWIVCKGQTPNTTTTTVADTVPTTTTVAETTTTVADETTTTVAETTTIPDTTVPETTAVATTVAETTTTVDQIEPPVPPTTVLKTGIALPVTGNNGGTGGLAVILLGTGAGCLLLARRKTAI